MGGRGSTSGLKSAENPKETSLADRIRQAREEAQAYRESQNQQKRESAPAGRDTKKQSEITEYISKQTGIDLNQYRDSTSRSFEPKDAVNVDWKRMPRDVKNRILDLSNQYKGSVELTFEDVGAWMKQIRIRRKR